jgi:HK97 gp10 family phage protein
MNVTKLVGWQGVQRDLAKLPYLIDQKKFFIAVFRKSGNIIKKKAKSLVPVDEGILKKAIKVFVTGAGRKFGFVTIGVKIPKGEQWDDGPIYGQNVEFGTSTQAASPFMRPAFDQTKNEVRASMISGAKAIVARAIKGLSKGKRYYQLKI